MSIRKHHYAIIALTMLSLSCKPGGEAASTSSDRSSETGKVEVDDPNNIEETPVTEPTAGATDDSNDNVVVTAGILSIGTGDMSLRDKFSLLVGAQSYEGIGTNYSEVVVEGFKIKLGGISFGTGVAGTQSMTSTEVFNWSGEEKDLEIRDGFNGTVEESADVPVGSYDWLNVAWSRDYDLKAYAYFDRDYDGDPDWTLFTTASGLQLVEGMLDMSTRDDYEYFHYASTSTDPYPYNGTITIPSEPLVVKANEKLYVNLFIDSFRCVKAWDGRLGDGSDGDPWSFNPPTTKDGSWNPTHAPTMGFPFNSAMVETNPSSPGKPYKVGVPSFAITSVPMFTTASYERENIRAETYLGSWTLNNYTPYNTSNIIVLFNEGEDPADPSDDVPFIGAFNGGDGSEHLHVGSIVRHFTVNDDNTFNFYAGFTTGIGSHPEWNDGGYYYNRDISYAGHRGLNFPRLTVDESGTGLIGNATRCDDEYNYCVPDENDVKNATNGATKTVYLKRVR